MKPKTHEVIATVTLCLEVEAGSVEEAARKARDTPLCNDNVVRYDLDLVDDREVVGNCEGCSKVLFDGDLYTTDCDLVRICETCCKS